MVTPPSSTTPTTGRYYTRDQILLFIMSVISAMRSASIISMLWSMSSCYTSIVSVLICHASIIYIINLFHLYIIIFILELILFLIWKLPNCLTIQKPYYRLFPELTMASFVDALRPEKFSGAHYKRWSVKVTDWLTAMKVF